jgi:hypothetical protein
MESQLCSHAMAPAKAFPVLTAGPTMERNHSARSQRELWVTETIGEVLQNTRTEGKNRTVVLVWSSDTRF